MNFDFVESHQNGSLCFKYSTPKKWNAKLYLYMYNTDRLHMLRMSQISAISKDLGNSFLWSIHAPFLQFGLVLGIEGWVLHVLENDPTEMYTKIERI